MLFLISINLTVLFLIAAVILHYTSITSDPKWERWCGQALLMTIIPVIIIPAVSRWHIPVNPIYFIVAVWGLILLLYVNAWRLRLKKEKAALQDEGAWKCPKCHEYNTSLNLVCWNCSTAKKV